MPLNIETDHDKQLIIFVLEGDITINELKQLKSLIKIHLITTKYKKILGVVRDSNPLLTHFDHYEYTSSLLAEYSGISKFALLANPATHLDNAAYIEDVANQSNLPLKAFFDEKDAWEWLDND